MVVRAAIAREPVRAVLVRATLGRATFNRAKILYHSRDCQILSEYTCQRHTYGSWDWRRPYQVPWQSSSWQGHSYPSQHSLRLRQSGLSLLEFSGTLSVPYLSESHLSNHYCQRPYQYCTGCNRVVKNARKLLQYQSHDNNIEILRNVVYS